MPEALTLDVDAVTTRMLVDFKERTGQNLMDMLGTDLVISETEPELLAGVIWIALRTSGRPDATWDEALDTPFTSLTFEVGEAEDPTSASSDAP